MAAHLQGLTRGSLVSTPTVCHECVWWQSRGTREANKERWMDSAEDDWGAWGTVYLDENGRTLGSMQYGPAELFPRAADLPAGPPSDDAVLVTCAYLVESSSPWVMQSLFLAAIGDAKDKGAKALEAFAYRYPEGESAYERFQVHKTIFPRDFLSDFGFTHAADAGTRGARAPRARRPSAGRRREPHEGAAGRQGSVLPGPGAGAAEALARREPVRPQGCRSCGGGRLRARRSAPIRAASWRG